MHWVNYSSRNRCVAWRSLVGEHTTTSQNLKSHFNLTVSLKFLLVIVMISLPVAPRPTFVLSPPPTAVLLPAVAAAPTTPSRKNKPIIDNDSKVEQRMGSLGLLLHDQRDLLRSPGAEAILNCHNGLQGVTCTGTSRLLLCRVSDTRAALSRGLRTTVVWIVIVHIPQRLFQNIRMTLKESDPARSMATPPDRERARKRVKEQLCGFGLDGC